MTDVAPPPEAASADDQGDDAGSETLARYEYQISLAALACVQMLVDDDILEIVCEWREDFIIVRTDGEELVSVKHLEPSRGPWSTAAIVDDGGLAHLFRWWKRSGEPRCTLKTNGGLKAGSREAATIALACDGTNVAQVAELIYARLGAADADEAARFGVDPRSWTRVVVSQAALEAA